MPARPPPMARGIGEPEVVRVARRESCAMAMRQGTPPPLLVLRAHRVAGTLRGDHQHVDVGARLDEVEVDVEPVREEQARRRSSCWGRVRRL